MFVFRWAHLIAGIMWIGNSMLFNWLDRNLEHHGQLSRLSQGKIFMVHSGAFYDVEKKLLEPGELPTTLQLVQVAERLHVDDRHQPAHHRVLRGTAPRFERDDDSSREQRAGRVRDRDERIERVQLDRRRNAAPFP